MAHLSPAERARGAIAASAATTQVALPRRALRCKATIVMPITTPHIKTIAEALGAKVVLWATEVTRMRAMALQKVSRATFVHPYDDPDVIAGQGTVGMEICASARTRSTRSSSRSAAAG
jgi:threonine dehydratase